MLTPIALFLLATTLGPTLGKKIFSWDVYQDYLNKDFCQNYELYFKFDVTPPVSSVLRIRFPLSIGNSADLPTAVWARVAAHG